MYDFVVLLVIWTMILMEISVIVAILVSYLDDDIDANNIDVNNTEIC